MKHLWLLLIMGLASGCTSNQLYQAIGSPDPMGPPVRYPLDYPICHSPPSGGTIYAPLRLRIVGPGLPTDPDQLMALRKRNPNDDGCFTKKREPGVLVIPYINEKDTEYANPTSGWHGLDKTGRGYFTATSYKWALLNEADMRKQDDAARQRVQTRMNNMEKFGESYRDHLQFDQTVTLSGLAWRHSVTEEFKVYQDARLPEKLLGWKETYEHMIDGTHFLRYTGSYDASVIADPEWLAARRHLLRRLVEGVQIHPVTQEEIDIARAEYDRRRAIDVKCRSDNKCRAREEGR